MSLFMEMRFSSYVGTTMIMLKYISAKDVVDEEKEVE